MKKPTPILRRKAIARNVVPPGERCARSRCQRRRLLNETLCTSHWTRSLAKKSRYGVKRVKDEAGRSYASKAERDGMADLRERQRRGEIGDLAEQVVVELRIEAGRAWLECRLWVSGGKRGTRIEGARWDAAYTEGGRIVFADVKNGLLTDDFKRKARWMEALGFPVTVLDYKARGKKS